MTKRGASAAGVFLGLLCLIVAAALAAPGMAMAESGTMSIGPSKITVSLLRGDDYREVLRIENDSGVPMRIGFTPWNFAYDEKGQIHPIGAKDAERFRGAAEWVAPVKPFVVPPHTEATIPVDVAVPADASIGTHSAYLRVTGVPMVKRDAKQSVAKVRYQLNGLLLVVVQSPSKSETLKAGARLVSFETPKNVAFRDPVPFTAKIDNTGNVHLDLEGKIIIKNASGELVDVLPVRDHTLLPDARTTLGRRWSRPPLVGRFTAQLVGDCCIAEMNQSFRSPVVDFWYVSERLVYWAAAVTTALLLGYVLFRRRFRFRLVRIGADAE